MKVRAVVEMCAGSSDKKGGRRRRWAYDFNSLGALFGVKPETVRRMISSRVQSRRTVVKSSRFDPSDLRSIVEWWATRNGWKPPTTTGAK